MRKVLLLTLVCAFAIRAGVAEAHGVVGDYVFLEPLITEDPSPANELDMPAPSWTKTSAGNSYSIGFSIEKILWLDDEEMPRFSIGAASGWDKNSPFHGTSRQGFEGLELSAKWAFYYSKEHEFLASIGTSLRLPTGNTGIQESSHTRWGPTFFWEKGMGDLPNCPVLKYLRPLGFQSDFGYVPALGGPTTHNIFADAVIEYSLPFLSNNVRDVGLKWPLRNLYLFDEINYSQTITGAPGETFPNLRATPGIAYVSYYFELSVGTQFALNNASRPGNHAAVLGLLDIFYDSIFPKWGNWTINRGAGQ
ncbi:MAG TPA: hypothetical protein VEU51_09560 [Candidatus Acidoferrales bacterium]|nr:hypothetical protein [Candidatus Acidoferrales bacterium]